MKRRTWLALGAASAAALALGGGTLVLLQPTWRDGRLTAPARDIFASVGAAVLEGTMPNTPAARQALLARVDAVIAALPPHAQAELAQLLSVLATPAGRRYVAGLSAPWATAPTEEVRSALQSMRLSSVTLRRQGYQALHDVVSGAWFADASAWTSLGYPGPRDI